VLLLSHPSEHQIERFFDRARNANHTYSEVGATSGITPPHFTTDHNRVLLGHGTVTWSRAVDAIRRWEMFNIGWVRLYSPSTPIAAGENVAVLAHWLGCYWLNACRIVYVIEETSPLQRFGFAYGTLDDHAESGEERFTVEWNRESDEVWYDILAFSRPNQFLARIGYPAARRLQKRFAADSKRAMVNAVTRPS
jgi:uncharacterized protein (UPF0548 family)